MYNPLLFFVINCCDQLPTKRSPHIMISSAERKKEQNKLPVAVAFGVSRWREKWVHCMNDTLSCSEDAANFLRLSWLN